ncbi:putative UDP-glucose:glycoprotein glucosyltransferase [Trichinella spiralis]|uniref:UDP-glucose:glycoprotein glucosyltransferase n=1 Tax=Trichinella spiralis TaxID=6334 RepID=A0ABR3K9P9_TRISP
MFITFIFLANILLLVQPSEAYRGHSNDEIRLMDECSDEPYIREHLGEDDYMSLIDACVEERLGRRVA